ncbi:MAG: 30S ribosomal protein S12 methylthiotransferase RimO [Clostridiales bacterium]|nr:30S ribosomal protein S12 methylthiotransferase RimO [Clostridiales bacterium]
MMNLHVISLGCDKNRVDTEKMLYRLRGQFNITDDMADADVIIINTCGFILSAREESINTILEAANYKKDGKCRKLIVTGCLAQKYASELKEDLPEVDAFLGTNDYDKIGEALEGEEVICYNSANPCEEIGERILTTPPHFAYLKIADGCDNRCTYCTIPSIRGRYRSTDIESLLGEAKSLSDSGVKELILVAQDVTRYGIDLYGEYKLVELIRRLSELDFSWIRLMYCYPELVTDKLIDEIKNNPKVAKYIDIPLQHVDGDILKKMNRLSTEQSIYEVLNKLKEAGIAVRTTLMTGFPTESDEQFDKLYNFVLDNKLRHVGVFAYSDEDTPSSKMKGKVPNYVRHNRAKKIAMAHKNNVKEYNKSMIGKTVRVLYEDVDYDKMLFKGRTEDCAPDIDTYVYFKSDFADVGKFYNVKITGYKGYDLIGELVNE